MGGGGDGAGDGAAGRNEGKREEKTVATKQERPRQQDEAKADRERRMCRTGMARQGRTWRDRAKDGAARREMVWQNETKRAERTGQGRATVTG